MNAGAESLFNEAFDVPSLLSSGDSAELMDTISSRIVAAHLFFFLFYLFIFISRHFFFFFFLPRTTNRARPVIQSSAR